MRQLQELLLSSPPHNTNYFPSGAPLKHQHTHTHTCMHVPTGIQVYYGPCTCIIKSLVSCLLYFALALPRSAHFVGLKDDFNLLQLCTQTAASIHMCVYMRLCVGRRIFALGLRAFIATAATKPERSSSFILRALAAALEESVWVCLFMWVCTWHGS